MTVFPGPKTFKKGIGDNVTIIPNQLDVDSLDSCCNALLDVIFGLQNDQMTAENEARERQKLSRSSAQITHFLACALRAPKIAEFALSETFDSHLTIYNSFQMIYSSFESPYLQLL